jgi:hypothetical protein
VEKGTITVGDLPEITFSMSILFPHRSSAVVWEIPFAGNREKKK